MVADTEVSEARDTILIVDDEPVVLGVLEEQLREDSFHTESAGSLRALRERLAGPPPSLVLLDLHLPDGNGLDLLPRLRAAWPATAVIVMTGQGSVTGAVRAMRLGAFNYVQKPFVGAELSLASRQAIDTTRLQQRAEDDRLRNSARFSFDRIIARSEAMARVVAEARTVAASRATSVLLLGESGTGKGLVAGAIHYASLRAAQPFLKVTCSAIPESLLEAELFGHERGAFTDAKERRRGVFEAAHKGTVFLDEIGDMPPSLQAKLLGVVEDRAFSSVGGTRRIEVDVRIIAATHRDIELAVHEGRFREDLLYRLRVVPIILPPLRERPEDILPLAEVFLREFNREFGRSVTGFDGGAAGRLRGHTWPGNVRELRNVIERAMLFTSSDRLTASDLLIDLGYRPGVAHRQGAFNLPASGVDLQSVERDFVRQALARTKGNQRKAAKLLGITRDQLRYRVEKMGLAGPTKAHGEGPSPTADP